MRYPYVLFHLLSSAVLICAAVLMPAAALASNRTISPGDTLYKIGLECGVSVEDLVRANSLSDYMIYPGQVITVPDAPGAKAGTGREDGSPVRYTVQEGDCLYWIGEKYGVDYQKIMAANSLESEIIYPGMVFLIPGAIPSGPAQQGAQGGGALPEVSRGGYFQRPSAADVDLLARLITAEAGNQPYEGKVAVGAVVMNRVTRSKDFPKTIPGVINQYNDGTYQFEPVMNGWINKPATPESYQAARDALNGVDPTNGALYFYSDWVNQKWLTSKQVSRRIGELVFAY